MNLMDEAVFLKVKRKISSLDHRQKRHFYHRSRLMIGYLHIAIEGFEHELDFAAKDFDRDAQSDFHKKIERTQSLRERYIELINIIQKGD